MEWLQQEAPLHSSQWRKWCWEDRGSQVHHELHLQDIRRRPQSAGERRRGGGPLDKLGGCFPWLPGIAWHCESLAGYVLFPRCHGRSQPASLWIRNQPRREQLLFLEWAQSPSINSRSVISRKGKGAIFPLGARFRQPCGQETGRGLAWSLPDCKGESWSLSSVLV